MVEYWQRTKSFDEKGYYMSIIKRAISYILCIAFILGAFSLYTVAAPEITESEFAAEILRLKEKYPDGAYWSNSNGTVSSGALAGTSLVGNISCGSHYWSSNCGTFRLNGVSLGWQCHGYALLLAYEIFGTNANTWTAYYNSSRTFYAGDLVRIDSNNNGQSDDNDHTIFIYRVTDTHVYYTDCNQSGPCKINWSNGEMSLSALRSKFLFVRHLDGNTLTGAGTDTPVLTVTYNINGAAISPLGEYILTTDGLGLRLRSEPSISSTVLVGMPDGISINITETTESGGYLWGRVTYNSYTGWCAISYADEVYAVRRYYTIDDVLYDFITGQAYSETVALGSVLENGLLDLRTVGVFKDKNSFSGWSFSSSDDVIFEAGVPLYAEQIYPQLSLEDGSVCLGASWTRIPSTVHTISFDSNGGIGNMDSFSLIEEGIFMIPTPGFTKETYIFESYCVSRSTDGHWLTENGSWLNENEIASLEYSKKAFLPGEVYQLNELWTGNTEFGMTYTFAVNWRRADAVSLSVHTPPNKTAYKRGEVFEANGLLLEIEYEDNTKKIINEGYELLYDFSSVGNTFVTLTYNGLSVKQNVTVYDPPSLMIEEIDSDDSRSVKTIVRYLNETENIDEAFVGVVLEYDPDELVYEGFKAGESIDSQALSVDVSIPGKICISYSSSITSSTILEIDFMYAKEHDDGAVYDLIVADASVLDNNGNLYEVLVSDLSMSHPVRGDADADGMLTEDDAILLRSYLSEYDYDELKSYTEISEYADTDFDGDIDVFDLVWVNNKLKGLDTNISADTYEAEIVSNFPMACTPGDKFTGTIDISANASVQSAVLTVLLKDDNGNEMGEFSFSSASAGSFKDTVFSKNLVFDQAVEASSNGTLAYITISVPENAESGTYYVEVIGRDGVSADCTKILFSSKPTEIKVIGSVDDSLFVTGASIRPETSSYTAGLRFAVELDKAYFGLGESYKFDDADITFGALMVPKDILDELGFETIKDYYINTAEPMILDVPAKKIYSETKSKLVFTAVLTEIPMESYDRTMSVCPYALINGKILFASEVSASYFYVAELARKYNYSDEKIAASQNEAERAKLQSMADELDKIINAVKNQKNLRA